MHVHVHVQRIGSSLRRGGTRGIHLERFVQALEDPSSGLTYSALSGVRKQSVEDVERLFGPEVISFMKRNHYKDEAKYVEVVRNWRRSVDERGLCEDQRRQFRDDFISYILDEWMPWHRNGLDLSTLEVNRCVYLYGTLHVHNTPLYLYSFRPLSLSHLSPSTYIIPPHYSL